MAQAWIGAFVARPAGQKQSLAGHQGMINILQQIIRRRIIS